MCVCVCVRCACVYVCLCVEFFRAAAYARACRMLCSIFVYTLRDRAHTANTKHRTPSHTHAHQNAAVFASVVSQSRNAAAVVTRARILPCIVSPTTTIHLRQLCVVVRNVAVLSDWLVTRRRIAKKMDSFFVYVSGLQRTMQLEMGFEPCEPCVEMY